MYSISLIFDGTEYKLNHAQGYDITTIDGLTGLSGKLDTVQNNIGMGEIYTGQGTVGGLTITVQGYILDGNTAKKQQLCDILTPLRRGTLKLYNITRTAGGDQAVRQIDFVVKKTPSITQTTHAKFSFTLYAPNPFFTDVSSKSITSETANPVTVDGNVDAEYSMMIYVDSSTRLGEIIVYCDQGTTAVQYMYLDFRRLAAGYITNDFIKVSWHNGKLAIMSGSGSIIEVFHTQSTLSKLPHGSHSFSTYMKNDAGTIIYSGATFVIGYYPTYAGVVLSGI